MDSFAAAGSRLRFPGRATSTMMVDGGVPLAVPPRVSVDDYVN